MGPWTPLSSRARASSSVNPCTRSSGKPPSTSSPGPARVAQISATGSASSRRATKLSTCAEVGSSHWLSSMKQARGWRSAASAMRERAASPTRNRSGGAPEARPKAIARAPACGAGSRSRCCSRSGAHSWCRPPYTNSLSDSTPLTESVSQSCRSSFRYPSSALLPVPGSPRSTRTRLPRPTTSALIRSSAAHSVPRPSRLTEPADVDSERAVRGSNARAVAFPPYRPSSPRDESISHYSACHLS